ncbi:hypothetical protein [Streptomyces sp. NPDC059278]|uniref:hypothetical protein n=1 Tax=Streptomyces sp. NPDC059278 TaxID=3346801 RepID=UPI0036B80701
MEEHLAGLTGQSEPEDSVVWHSVGANIAALSGWSTPERHEALEAALHARFGNHPDDDQALDHLPAPLQERVLALIPLMREANHSAHHEVAD